jgi:hypothetical protein
MRDVKEIKTKFRAEKGILVLKGIHEFNLLKEKDDH